MFDNLERKDKHSHDKPISILRLSRELADLRHRLGIVSPDERLLVNKGDLQACDPTKAESTNKAFIPRWDRIKQSKEVRLFGSLHGVICNVIPYMLLGVKLQIKLTKAKRAFYLIFTKSDSTTQFKFLEAHLVVNPIVRISPI